MAPNVTNGVLRMRFVLSLPAAGAALGWSAVRGGESPNQNEQQQGPREHGRGDPMEEIRSGERRSPKSFAHEQDGSDDSGPADRCRRGRGTELRNSRPWR